MSGGLPPYIAVEGPIGVGKTAFTKKLAASLNYETLLENTEKNPFLERFYNHRGQAALQTQLFFLFERVRQIQSLRQADLFQTRRVADFVLQKDRLFAEMNLDADELKLYDNIYAHLTLDAPTPDLVVYLQAPVDVLMRRVAERGIPAEKNIDQTYLGDLVNTYTEFFHYYDEAPLLIVNTAEIDINSNELDFETLKNYLIEVKNGRHYYNPASLI